MELKKADDRTKLAVARDLLRECYKEGYSKDEVHTLVQFLGWVIRSSDQYEKELKEEIKKIEEELNMPYMLHIFQFLVFFARIFWPETGNQIITILLRHKIFSYFFAFSHLPPFHPSTLLWLRPQAAMGFHGKEPPRGADEEKDE